jgi:hypothetical protein
MRQAIAYPLRAAPVVRYPHRYTDERGVKMWQTVQRALKERGMAGFRRI